MKTLAPEKATPVVEVIKMIEDADVVTRRVKGLDWKQITEQLNEQGSALLKNVLTPEQCEALSALYPEDDRFRSRVVMARHGFGRGEYKYFNYPLPGIIESLRTSLYGELAPIANRWNQSMGIPVHIRANMPILFDVAMTLASCERRHFCCNTAQETITACIRTFTESMSFQSRLHSCFRNLNVIFKVANSYSRNSGRGCNLVRRLYHWAGRRGRFRCPSSAGSRNAGNLSREPSTRSESTAIRTASHPRHHLSRCYVGEINDRSIVRDDRATQSP